MTSSIPAYPLQWPAGWIPGNDGSVSIRLQNWSGRAIIDEADASWAMNLHWYAHKCRAGVYVRTDVYVHGKKKCYLLHRLIMGAKPGKLVDHRDGDGLNNRRGNLRIASHSQNGANRRIIPGLYSEFKGVTRDKRKRTNPWIAQITKDYRHQQIGTFADELVAAAAYDIYALALHGPFAKTNFGLRLGRFAAD